MTHQWFSWWIPPQMPVKQAQPNTKIDPKGSSYQQLIKSPAVPIWILTTKLCLSSDSPGPINYLDRGSLEGEQLSPTSSPPAPSPGLQVKQMCGWWGRPGQAHLPLLAGWPSEEAMAGLGLSGRSRSVPEIWVSSYLAKLWQNCEIFIIILKV